MTDRHVMLISCSVADLKEVLSKHTTCTEDPREIACLRRLFKDPLNSTHSNRGEGNVNIYSLTQVKCESSQLDRRARFGKPIPTWCLEWW